MAQRELYKLRELQRQTLTTQTRWRRDKHENWLSTTPRKWQNNGINQTQVAAYLSGLSSSVRNDVNWETTTLFTVGSSALWRTRADINASTCTHHCLQQRIIYNSVSTPCLKKDAQHFDCNLMKNYQILIIFSTNIPDTTSHQMIIQVPTSPSVYFCTTWGKTEQAKYALKWTKKNVKNMHNIIDCNSEKDYQISIIFSRNIPVTSGHQSYHLNQCLLLHYLQKIEQAKYALEWTKNCQ